MKASEKYRNNQWTSSTRKINEDGSVTITLYDPKSQGKKVVSFTEKDGVITEDEDDTNGNT
jgi:hypothetical protein